MEIVNTFLKMTIFERSPGIVKGLFIDLPFAILKSLWDKFLVCPKQASIIFDAAVERFKENIVELFGDLPIGRGHVAFFPAKFRNLILQAGSTMTLLDVTYNGVKRIVEPYSLAYKTRKDGISSEYFYVYDRTGGRESGPGIKTFLQFNIQEIINTDIKFEPRFEVELSKAGEYHRKSYFGKPFSVGRVRSKGTFKFGPTYTYQCQVCGKLFHKKSYNPSLNSHKDKYGNNCYGELGMLIETKY